MAASQCVFPRLRGLVTVTFVAMSLGIVPPSFAQGVPQLTVGHLTGEDRPVIDGKVDEAVWSTEAAYSTFTQQEPSEGQPATERTDVWFFIDETNLYVAVVCYDTEPDGLVVSQSRRDANLGNTDSVQILLDTFNDGQNAFVFGTNPFGIEFDAQVMAEGQTGGGGFGGGGFNLNWDADWTVSASPSERGWEAEFAIPLRTLRYEPGEERVWGVNVLRNIRRKNEQVFLAPVPRGYSLQRVSVAGKLNGLSLPTRRDLKFTPFVAGSFNDNKTLLTDTVDRTGDIGLDVKWGVRADLTLDLTVNTDFAQVEADEEQVNLTRFALFFPEKRAFFLENAPGLSARPAPEHRSVLLTPDRPSGGPADRHYWCRPTERQTGWLQRRASERADGLRSRSPDRGDDLPGEQLLRVTRPAGGWPVNVRRDVRQPAGRR